MRLHLLPKENTSLTEYRNTNTTTPTTSKTSSEEKEGWDKKKEERNLSLDDWNVLKGECIDICKLLSDMCCMYVLGGWLARGDMKKALIQREKKWEGWEKSERI